MKHNKNYRWFILGIGVLAQIIFAMGFAGIPVTNLLMKTEYKFSVVELGYVLGAMGLGVACSELVWGILTDKLGDKFILALGLFSSSLVFMYISFYLTPEIKYSINYIYLSLALGLAGICGGSINSSSGRTVMSWFSDSERGFAMSIRQTAIPIGGAIGTGLLPFLAWQYGFTFMFFFLAIAGIIIGTIVIFFIKSNDLSIKDNINHYDEVSVFYNKDIWLIIMASAFLTVPQMSVLTFGGIYLEESFGVSLFIISFLLIGVQICGGILRIWSGHYTDKNKNRIVLMKNYSLLGTISALILAFFSNNNILGLIFLIFTGLWGHAWHGIAYTEVAVKAGINKAGTALGMIGTAVFISSFLTPILISQVITYFNWNLAWLVVGILTLLAYICFILVTKKDL